MSQSVPQVVLYDAAAGAWQHFSQPCEIIQTERCDEVMDCLRRMEQLVESRGLYAAGFVSYEAAPAFDRALTVRESVGFPLLWFALFDKMETGDSPAVRWTSESVASQIDGLGGPSYMPWQPSITSEEYISVISQLRERIAAGETYQVNYTFRLRQQRCDPWEMFVRLVEAQRARYSAFIDTEHFAICSASPELFFELQGDRIVTRPMKGTAARGLWQEDDLARAAALAASEKDRAENAMIVDMMRNDLGRVARVGSVEVSDLFRVERYPTLWQMTSCVSAETRASLAGIFAAMFPCASVTGAPKARTMRIIAETETAPRRIYTGSIGMIAPGRRARFNVAIRTVLINKESQQAEYGVGGGVVWDSTPQGEYDECLLKARVLTTRRPEFSLFESLLWRPDGGYWLLEEHLRRLKSSAEYFDIAFDIDAVVTALDCRASGLPPQPHKVRLLVDRTGSITVEATAQNAGDLREPVHLELASQPVDASDVFLYHKTTRREVYESAFKDRTEGDDVLLYNQRGEVTETCRANIAVRIGQDFWTPPISCGLLAGTCRARLLADGKLRERVIPLEMLDSCDELFSLNSVRGLQRAVLGGPRRPRDAAAALRQ
jgi:para-aminobenzoate synthetase/4-amino-4-deoxychorismate lyase